MIRKLLYSVLLCLSFLPTQAQAEGTLVLLVDMSYTIDANEMVLQMDGYAETLNTVPGLKKFRFEVLTYSGEYEHVVNNGSHEDAIDFFKNWHRPKGKMTCIDGVVGEVRRIYHTLPTPVIIDITGDGFHNCPPQQGYSTVKELHNDLDWLAEQGAKINTLFIGQVNNVLVEEYEPFSKMSRNGFSLRASNFYEFEYALFQKLIFEMVMLNGRVAEW